MTNFSVVFLLDSHDVADVGSGQLPLLLLRLLPLLLLAMLPHCQTSVPRHHRHVASVVLEGNHRLELLGEDDSAVEERRDDVVNEEVDAGSGLLVQFHVVLFRLVDDSASHHPIRFPPLVVLTTRKSE